MVLDSSKEKGAIAPDEPVKWFVAIEAVFLNEGSRRLLSIGTPGNIVFDELSAAIEKAKADSMEQALYVWPSGQPLDKRQAIAVAIGGELYFRRDAQPDTVSASERRNLAGVLMAGMISSNMLQEWSLEELTAQGLEQADSLIAASQGASN